VEAEAARAVAKRRIGAGNTITPARRIAPTVPAVRTAV